MESKVAFPPAQTVLANLLEDHDLVAKVRSLPGPVLGKLIRHVGLEDAGEIVALATVPQLTELLDDDLWVARKPGDREAFDARRFSLWTEILLESGPREAAQKLAALDETFLAAALSRLLRVFDSDFLTAYYSEADEDDEDRTRFEKALEGGAYHEFDAYLVGQPRRRRVGRPHRHPHEPRRERSRALQPPDDPLAANDRESGR